MAEEEQESQGLAASWVHKFDTGWTRHLVEFHGSQAALELQPEDARDSSKRFQRHNFVR